MYKHRSKLFSRTHSFFQIVHCLSYTFVTTCTNGIYMYVYLINLLDSSTAVSDTNRMYLQILLAPSISLSIYKYTCTCAVYLQNLLDSSIALSIFKLTCTCTYNRMYLQNLLDPSISLSICKYTCTCTYRSHFLLNSIINLQVHIHFNIVRHTGCCGYIHDFTITLCAPSIRMYTIIY